MKKINESIVENNINDLDEKGHDKAFIAIMNGNEEEALKIINDESFDVTRLNVRNNELENLLATAACYNMKEVVVTLKNNPLFQTVITKGRNPFSAWIEKIIEYQTDLNRYEEPFWLESNIKLQKRIEVLEELLNIPLLELPKYFLFNFPFEPCIHLTTATRNFKVAEQEILLLLLKSPKVDKIINEKLSGETFLEKSVAYSDNIEVVDLILNNKKFTEVNKKDNTWFSEYAIFGNVRYNSTATCCYEKVKFYEYHNKEVIKKKSLKRIVIDYRFGERETLEVLRELLGYKLHILESKHKSIAELVNEQIEEIVPEIIKRKPKSIEYKDAYEELIFIAALTGKVKSFKVLLEDKDIPLSLNTYNLIKDYALRFFEKDPSIVKQLEEILESAKEKIPNLNNLDKSSVDKEALARHIFMYFTALNTVIYQEESEYPLSYIALENILKYFEDYNSSSIVNTLTDIWNSRTRVTYQAPFIDVRLQRGLLAPLDQTREMYEYCMYRCYNHNTIESEEQFKIAKKIANYLTRAYTLLNPNKEDAIKISSPKRKIKRIPTKVIDILINTKI